MSSPALHTKQSTAGIGCTGASMAVLMSAAIAAWNSKKKVHLAPLAHPLQLFIFLS